MFLFDRNSQKCFETIPDIHASNHERHSWKRTSRTVSENHKDVSNSMFKTVSILKEFNGNVSSTVVIFYL